METFAELKRICSYITNNKLSDKELYDLLENYQKKLYKFAWERGYHMRSFIQKRSKSAASTADRKISENEQEKIEDNIALDINLIKSGTLITLENGDDKPVEFLQEGEVIVVGEQTFQVKAIEKIDKNYKLIV